MGSFGIGMGEVLIILVLALLIFGPSKVPDIARGLGKAVRQFSRYSQGLTSEFRDEFERELSVGPDTLSESANSIEETASERQSSPSQTEGAESQDHTE